MKRTATIIAMCAATALFAGQDAKPQVSDAGGRFAIWYKEFEAKFPDDHTTLLDVSGNPFHGYSREQNLVFSSTNFVGTIEGKRSEKLKLKEGTLTGNVTVEITDKTGSSVIKTQKVVIQDDGTITHVTVPGSMTVTNTTSTENGPKSTTVTSNGGTFLVKSKAEKDENPLISSNVSGPVKVVIDDRSTKDQHNVYTITGDRLASSLEGTDTVLKLTGHVHGSADKDSEKNSFLGDWDANEATIVIDANKEIKSIKTHGDPATATVKDKKGGG